MVVHRSSSYRPRSGVRGGRPAYGRAGIHKTPPNYTKSTCKWLFHVRDSAGWGTARLQFEDAFVHFVVSSSSLDSFSIYALFYGGSVGCAAIAAEWSASSEMKRLCFMYLKEGKREREREREKARESVSSSTTKSQRHLLFIKRTLPLRFRTQLYNITTTLNTHLDVHFKQQWNQ